MKSSYSTYITFSKIFSKENRTQYASTHDITMWLITRAGKHNKMTEQQMKAEGSQIVISCIIQH